MANRITLSPECAHCGYRYSPRSLNSEGLCVGCERTRREHERREIRKDLTFARWLFGLTACPLDDSPRVSLPTPEPFVLEF